MLCSVCFTGIFWGVYFLCAHCIFYDNHKLCVKQRAFLHRGGGFQGQFKQADSPEIMEMSLLRIIPRRCCGVWAEPHALGVGDTMSARVLGRSDTACVSCVWSRRDGGLLCAVSVLLDGAGDQGGCSGAVWGRAGSAGTAQGTSRSIPTPSARGYPPWGSSTDGLASCKVILYFIASFLP